MVRTLSLNSLAGLLGKIDFLKLDIEGAERDMFEQNPTTSRPDRRGDTPRRTNR